MIKDMSPKAFLQELRHEIGKDNVSQGAAALAYYLTLAIFPALILLIAIIPFLPVDRVDEAMMRLLGQILPNQAYKMVEDVVVEVTTNRRGGLLSLSLLGALWASSMGMYAVMRQLNITYHVEEDRGLLRVAGTALLLSTLFGVLTLGAFSLIVLGGVIEDWLGVRFGFNELLLNMFIAFRWLIVILASLVAFSVVYRFGPNVDHNFVLVTPGSVVGVALFIAASLLFSLYTRNFGVYDAVYGSIGAMIVLMLWLYIAGFVVLLGSEINTLVEQYNSSPFG